jgi:RNA polymerase sigma-70 factor (ECF subfamily)
MDLSSERDLDQAIAAVKSNAEALNSVLAHYRPFLHLVAEESLGSAIKRREDASDVVQRTLVEAAIAAPQFQGQCEMEFTSWLRQILRRNVLNAARDHRAQGRDVRKERYLDSATGSASISWHLPQPRQDTPSVCVIKSEAALNLARAIDQLPEDQRTAVSMRHLSGESLLVIADAMGKTPASVAGLLRRGMEQLRSRLPDDAIV